MVDFRQRFLNYFAGCECNKHHIRQLFADTSRESSIFSTRKRTSETKSSLHQMQNAVLLKQEKVQVIHDTKIASSSYSFVDVKMKMGG